jgi:hypothetical protein
VRAAVTAGAVCAAVAVVLTGPTRPVPFDMRLPLAVLALGAAWTAFPARRPADARRPAARVATPWLILTSAAGIASLTVRLATSDPALDGALLAAGAAACCLGLGAWVTCGGRGRRGGPDSAGR